MKRLKNETTIQSVAIERMHMNGRNLCQPSHSPDYPGSAGTPSGEALSYWASRSLGYASLFGVVLAFGIITVF